MTPPLRILAALALATSLAGCISTRQLRCEARGGRPWTHYRTAHFDLYSDGKAPEVERLAGRLERLLAQIVVGVAGQAAEVPPARVRVVALRDPYVYLDLAMPGAAAYFRLDTLGGDPTIVLPLEFADGVPQIVAHELVHYVSRYFYPRQPLWFSEGLATYFQSLAAGSPARGGGWAGGVDPLMGAWLLRAKRMDPKALLTATSYPHDRRENPFHLTSWLLYLWLRNERPDQLTVFQRRLEEAVLPEAAWKAAFPELDPAREADMATLARALEAYKLRGTSEAWAVEAAYDPRILARRHVPAPEVHAVLRTSRSWLRGKPEAAMARYLADIEEQLAEAPLDPEALHARALLQKRSPVPELRQAVEARPEDWRAWFYLARALLWQPPAEGAVPEGAGPASPAAASAAVPTEVQLEARKKDQREAEARLATPEREAALRRALALSPEGGTVENELAWLLHLTDRPGEALPLARQAVKARPLSPARLDTLAQVSADLGRCGEALVAERRAVALWPDLEEALAKLRARCEPAPAASPLPPAAGGAEQR